MSNFQFLIQWNDGSTAEEWNSEIFTNQKNRRPNLVCVRNFGKILVSSRINHSHWIHLALPPIYESSFQEFVILCQSVVQIFTRTRYIDLNILSVSLFANPRSEGSWVRGHPVYTYVSPDIVCAWKERERRDRTGGKEGRGGGKRGRWGSRKWTVAWSSRPTSPRYNGVSNRDGRKERGLVTGE